MAMVLQTDKAFPREIPDCLFELIFASIGVAIGLDPLINVHIDDLLIVKHHRDKVVLCYYRHVVPQTCSPGGITAGAKAVVNRPTTMLRYAGVVEYLYLDGLLYPIPTFYRC